MKTRRKTEYREFGRNIVSDFILRRLYGIYIFDLHGNVNKGEKCPDGSADFNIFNIKKVGVCIAFFVKTGKKKNNKEKENNGAFASASFDDCPPSCGKPIVYKRNAMMDMDTTMQKNIILNLNYLALPYFVAVFSMPHNAIVYKIKNHY